jgi:hydroxymethylglutaryl-CoA reductase (NADPH)
MDQSEIAAIPMRRVGPVLMCGPVVEGEYELPLSTFETPLWPSTRRGARVTAHAGGIRAVVVDERMTRSILLRTEDAVAAQRLASDLLSLEEKIAELVRGTSRFAKLQQLRTKQVGNLVWLRIEITSGDAAGHNMVTLAADRVMTWLRETRDDMAYGSISGNFCTDKKVSAINSICGRGKSVVADCEIPADLCRRFLKTTPEQIVQLNVEKNLLGSIVAGSLHSANAHFANMLLAFYLATGQDGANVVEASQGITHCEVRDDGALYFSVSLPNLIVGSVGNGKELPFVQENLGLLGCLENREPSVNGRRLAVFCAASVLCGELSLLAAQTNPRELMEAHVAIERNAR